MFLGMALTLRTFFSMYVPLFGENAMRINIGGIFSIMPSILFGPIFGGLTSGLSDFIGFMLRPSGQYLPFMTLIVALGGFIRGVLWLLLRGRNVYLLRFSVGLVALFFILFGAYNWNRLHFDGITNHYMYYFSDGGRNIDTSEMATISRWLIVRSQDTVNPATTLSTMITSVTRAPIVAGAFGFLLIVIDLFMSIKLLKNNENSNTKSTSIMPLLLAMLIASVIVSTFNTLLLRATIFTSWQLLPFVVVWLPRVFQTIVTTTIYAYFVAFLLGICKQLIKPLMV